MSINYTLTVKLDTENLRAEKEIFFIDSTLSAFFQPLTYDLFPVTGFWSINRSVLVPEYKTKAI